MVVSGSIYVVAFHCHIDIWQFLKIYAGSFAGNNTKSVQMLLPFSKMLFRHASVIKPMLRQAFLSNSLDANLTHFNLNFSVKFSVHPT